MVLFEYLGQLHVMIAFESKSVQIFEYKTGHSVHEFEFWNSMAEYSKMKPMNTSKSHNSIYSKNTKARETINERNTFDG